MNWWPSTIHLLTVAHMNIEMKPRLGRYHHWFFGGISWILFELWLIRTAWLTYQIWINCGLTMCFPVFSQFSQEKTLLSRQLGPFFHHSSTVTGNSSGSGVARWRQPGRCSSMTWTFFDSQSYSHSIPLSVVTWMVNGNHFKLYKCVYI